MTSTLCENCSKVTLDNLCNYRSFIAGSYTDLAISAKTDCKLCKVVFNAFQFKHSRWAPPKDAEEEKRKNQFSAITMWITPDPPANGPFGFCEDIFDPKIDPALSRNSRVSFEYGDSLKGGLAMDNADPEHPVFAKQTVVAKVDPQLPFVRKCLQLCKSEHKEICGQSISRVEGHPPRRLYNIAEKFLESFDPEKSEYVKYTALSYLWGSAVTEKIRTLAEGTTKDKLENRWTDGFKDNIPPGSLLPSRATPGSFDLKDREKYDVPLAYFRAIEITESLGINYIWIDSICIIQDGDKGEDQGHHFGDFAGGVGQIYENAVLTLTAIGPNASVDMYSDRKVYTQDDPEAAYLSDGKVFLTKDTGTFESPLQPTVAEQYPKGWESRGWPFQERMLSRRLVYFTQRQQYFECCKIFFENGETRPTHDFRKRLRNLHDSPEMLSLWPSIVVDYTPRELGRYVDRLNGISAVATQMCKRAERLDLSPRLTFNYPSGVFLESLARDLFWQLSDGQNIDDYLGFVRPAKGRPTGWKLPPPSWSWGQWKGGVFFPSPFHSADLERLSRPSQGYGPHSQLTADDVIIETDRDDGTNGPFRTRLIVKKPRLLQSVVLGGPMEPSENQQERKLLRGRPKYGFNDYGSPLKFSTLRSPDSGLFIGWAHLDPGMSCINQTAVGLVVSENRNWDNAFESWNVVLLARKENVEHIPEETRPPWATDKTVLAVEDSQYVRIGMGEVWKEELSVGEAIVVV